MDYIQLKDKTTKAPLYPKTYAGGVEMSPTDNTTIKEAIEQEIEDRIEALDAKQDKLVAGDNITINNNRINAIVPAVAQMTGQSTSVVMSQKAITDALSNKQHTLAAGTNITIENNVISALGDGSEPQVVSFVASASSIHYPGTYYNKAEHRVEIWSWHGSTLTLDEYHDPLETVVYCNKDDGKLYRYTGVMEEVSKTDVERQVVSFINMGQQHADPSSAGVYYNGDTKQIETWEDQGTAQLPNIVKTEHHTPLVTVVYCDKRTDKLYRWDGTTMVTVAGSGEWVRIGSITPSNQNNITIANLKDYRKIKIFRVRTTYNADLTANVIYEIISEDGNKVLQLGYHNDGNLRKEFTSEDIGIGYECRGVSINNILDAGYGNLMGFHTNLYPEWIDDSCKYRIRTANPAKAWDGNETITVYGQKR